MTLDPVNENIMGQLKRDLRHCRLCGRELLLPDGTESRIWLFDPRPDIVYESEDHLFDDNRYHTVPYVYCNSDHRDAFKRWERNPESR